MQHALPLLKGRPIWWLRRGQFPNKAEMADLCARYPGCTLRVETAHAPYTTFVVTAQRR